MAIRRRRSLADIVDEYLEDVESLTEGIIESRLAPTWDTRTSTLEALSNVRVLRDRVLITADMPLAKGDSVTIEVYGKNTIQMCAEMSRAVSCRELGLVQHRGEFRRFCTYVKVPVPVDFKKMKFKLKKGVLEIDLPRRLERRAER